MLDFLFRKRSPGDVEQTFAKASALHQEGNLIESDSLCRTVLAANPRHFDALYLLGMIKLRQGHHIDALASFDRALSANEGSVDAHVYRGDVLVRLGRLEEALVSYERALSLVPGMARALAARGNVLRLSGRYEEAHACLEQALASDQSSAATLLALGQTLAALGRPLDAVAALDRALKLEPENADAFLNRGNALHALGSSEEALSDFAKAVELAPHYAGAAYNLGIVLRSLGRRDEAIAAFDLAIAIRPDYPDALNTRAVTLGEKNRLDEALSAFEQLAAIAPDYPDVLGNIAYTSAHLGQWDARQRVLPGIEDAVIRGKTAAAPLVLLSVSSNAATQLACARAHVAARHPVREPPLWRGERYGHGKIRVAYLSANYHDHAVAYLMAGLFEQHDRGRFEVTGVSFGPPDRGAMRSRLVHAFDRFIDVRAQSDADTARMLRDMEIDIAVDLMGHTADARPDILAQRPAPVQVNYLGYPGTMGAAYIDYILADQFVIPEDHRAHYAESVVYLPDTFQANDTKRPSLQRIPTRAEAGLPSQGFVYCAFNNGYKITPDVFAVWMRLLRDVKGSVLWLYSGNSSFESNLRREAQNRGVDPARLCFASKAPYEDYLARYGAADLFLDTFPFNGGTTVSDALWSGVPVLTCSGNAFAARMAGSLIAAVGLSELVTDSLEDYEALAIDLGTKPAVFGEYKTGLARNRATAPLFDTDRFRRHLEAAYATMREIADRGEKPRSFAIDRLPF